MSENSTMTIEHINKLPRPELHQELFKCCSSMAWVENLAKKGHLKD